MSEPGPTQPRQPNSSPATGSYAPQAGPPSSIPQLFLPPQQPDEIGRVGDYRILRALGEGGMGAVYLAEDTRLQRKVALKFLLPAIAASEHGKFRFIREARAAARIKHENVITIYEVDEVNGVPFIAMERLKGTTLDGWIRQNGPPPIPQAVRIVKEVLAGLQAAHAQGLVHRDIKPANIWLEAPKGKVRLLDFGLAVQPEGDERVTSTGVVMGTAHYMAPEQAAGKPVDQRSDLFSVGVVLYQLTTGQMPFDGVGMMAVLLSVCNDEPPPPAQVNPAIPAGLDRLIRQLLAKDPKARPQTAAEVIQALSGPAATQSVAAIPVPQPMEVPAPTTGGFTPAPTTAPSQPGSATAPGPGQAPQPLPVPVAAPVAIIFAQGAVPPQTVANASDHTRADDRRRRRDDHDRDDYDRDRGDYRRRPRQRDDEPGADIAGIASLILGGVSIVAVFFCCVGGHIIAVPLAGIGLVAGIFGRGGNRVVGMMVNGFALIPGVAAFFLVATLLSMVGCPRPDLIPPDRPAPNSNTPGSKGAPADTSPGTLEVQFDDKYRQAGYQKYEFFIDGKVQPVEINYAVTTLKLPQGPHAVVVKYNGEEIVAKSVKVKAPSQGKTVVAIEWVEPDDIPGVLELQYPQLNSAQWANVELFLDDKLTEIQSSPQRALLPPGKHAVTFKKNGIEIYSETVTVKKPAEGATFCKPNLLDVVSSNVTIQNRAVLVADAYIEVDGAYAKEWNKGTNSVVFDAFVGEHAIKVKTKSGNAVVESFNVKVLPGQPQVIKMNK